MFTNPFLQQLWAMHQQGLMRPPQLTGLLGPMPKKGKFEGAGKIPPVGGKTVQGGGVVMHPNAMTVRGQTWAS